MKKLALSMDEDVIARAKKLAAVEGTARRRGAAMLKGKRRFRRLGGGLFLLALVTVTHHTLSEKFSSGLSIVKF